MLYGPISYITWHALRLPCFSRGTCRPFVFGSILRPLLQLELGLGAGKLQYRKQAVSEPLSAHQKEAQVDGISPVYSYLYIQYNAAHLGALHVRLCSPNGLNVGLGNPAESPPKGPTACDLAYILPYTRTCTLLHTCLHLSSAFANDLVTQSPGLFLKRAYASTACHLLWPWNLAPLALWT